MPCSADRALDLHDAMVEVDQHHAVGDDALAADRDVLEGGDRALLAHHGLRPDLDLALVGADLRAVADPRPAAELRPARPCRSRSVTPGPTKHSPSVCRRPRQRSFSHIQRSDQPRVGERQHPVRRAEAQQRQRAAVQRRSARRDTLALAADPFGDCAHHGRIVSARWHDPRPHGGLQAHASPSDCSRATSARWRGASRSSRTTTPRAGRSCARSTRTRARPPSSASPARPAPGKSTLIGALVKLRRARRTARSPCSRSTRPRRSAAARCSATASG